MLKRKDGKPLFKNKIFPSKPKSAVPENYWGDEVPNDDKTVVEKIKAMNFFQTALTVFGVAILILLIAIIISAAAGGMGGPLVGLLGIVAFGISCYGVWVAIYGHFFVHAESKRSWLLALIPNLALAMILLITYIIGI